MVDPPADGEPTRRKRTRKPTDEVARLRIQLADEYVKHTEEVVALHERIAELEATLKEVAPFVERGAGLEEENAELRQRVAGLEKENADLTARLARIDVELDQLKPRIDAAEERSNRPQTLLARKRRGRVSETKPYRARVLANEQLKRDIAVSDDPVGLVIQYCKAQKVGYPNRRQTIKRWLVKAGLLLANT
jgi:predicted nuclease with TOPRIM domain